MNTPAITALSKPTSRPYPHPKQRAIMNQPPRIRAEMNRKPHNITNKQPPKFTSNPMRYLEQALTQSSTNEPAATIHRKKRRRISISKPMRNRDPASTESSRNEPNAAKYHKRTAARIHSREKSINREPAYEQAAGMNRPPYNITANTLLSTFSLRPSPH